MRGTEAHVPPAQVESTHVRVSVPPDSAQTVGKPPQAPYAPQVVIPHEVPVVERVHARLSLRIVDPHTPLPQTRSVHVRLSVPPDSPQVPVNPPHAP